MSQDPVTPAPGNPPAKPAAQPAAPQPPAQPAPAAAPQAAPPQPAPQPAPQQPAPKPASPPPKPPPQPAAKPAAKPAVPRPAPVAKKSRLKMRHLIVVLSFLMLVVGPIGATWWYLYNLAADQYVSKVAFTVRTEEVASPLDVLGGISSLSSGGSLDTDILYQFLQSQDLISIIDDKLDLKTLYSKPEDDFFFGFDPSGSIEDLVEYWDRMVRIDYDASARLIELRVLAFGAEDARNVAQEIFSQSSIMINQLSAIAREDTTRYASQELEKSANRLKQARQAITQFRTRTQIVDPQADVQGQVGLLNNLQAQLAEAIIDLDLLREVSRDGDPRVEQGKRKIEVIQIRIDEERKKFSISAADGNEDYASLIGQYEALSVDLEFAQAAYVATRSAYDSAVAEASRQSRYLAAYIKPTQAERSTYPKREVILALAGVFLFLIWSIIILVYYSVRDRR